MAAKIEILVVGSEPFRQVRATALLPGLGIHRAPDCPPGEQQLNITHVQTGLAVLTHVDPGCVDAVRQELSKVGWDILPDEFVRSETHWVAMEMASKIARPHHTRHEEKIAQQVGGKRQPASGSRQGARRDILSPRFLIEDKTTASERLSVRVADLEFLRRQATMLERTALFTVELARKEEVVLVPYWEVPDAVRAALQLTVLNLYTRETYVVTEDVRQKAVRGHAWELNFASGKWLLMGWERFLDVAKGGADGTASDAD